MGKTFIAGLLGAGRRGGGALDQIRPENTRFRHRKVTTACDAACKLLSGRSSNMRTPIILLLLSAAAFAALFVGVGPVLTLPLAVACLSGIASLILLLSAVLRRPPVEESGVIVPKRGRRKGRGRRQQVVIDGSNVMYWNGETPRLSTLKEVVRMAEAQGFQPGVIFDANAGYKLCDRYLSDRDFAKLLKLPGDRVLVVDKGEPADPMILSAARDAGATVISNDRFRDWAQDFPEVETAGHLVPGGYLDGQLWLDGAALAGLETKRSPIAFAA